MINSFDEYEKAKVEFNNTSSDQWGYKFSLQMALLEYRRQHNIFEVGDVVVFSILGNEVIQYADWLKSQNQDWIRHATDAEIEAGKRLELGK